jgi:hypothetical protein
MKVIKLFNGVCKYLIISSFMLIGFGAMAHPEGIPLTVELKKELRFKHAVNPSNSLSISNSFGDVNVKIGSSEQLNVEVKIRVNAINNELAEKILQKINVLKTLQNQEIAIKTVLEELGKYANQDPNVKFEINYLVVLPAYMPLKINNKFGTVNLPTMKAPLTLNLDNCQLAGNHILNEKSNLNFNFVKADVQNLIGANLNANYAKIKMGNLKNVKIVDHHSVISAQTAENLEGIFNYTKGVIDKISDKAKMEFNYSTDLKLEAIDEDMESINITSNYSDIDLPISNCDFDIKTLNGKLYVAPQKQVFFNKRPANVNKNIHIYSGQVGDSKSQKTKIIVISNNGDVKLDD